MSEIPWIKIQTTLFDNEKVKLIQSLPEGDSLLVIWINLLCYAGKVNQDGYIVISDNIPMSPEEMATVFNRSLNTMRLALSTFEKYKMIEIQDNSAIRIRNWEKYQNVESLKRVREQTRKRVAKHRAKEKAQQKALPEPSNVTVTLRNATDEDIDKDKDKDIDIEKDINSNINNKGMYEKRKRTAFKYTEEQYKLAKLLLREVRKNNPNFKDPNLERWANDFRLTMERDNRKGKEVQDLIIFTQRHHYWHRRILSAEKLRKLYDEIILDFNHSKLRGDKNKHEKHRRPTRKQAQYELKGKWDL